MKAPGLVPTTEVRDRLLILPDAKPKRRWPLVAGVLLLAAWTAAVAGIGVYLWQRGEVRDRDRLVAATQATNDDLTASLSGVDAQIANLQTEIASTRAELESALNGLDVAAGTSSAGLSQIASLQQQIASLQLQLEGQQQELRAAMGPRLHHGMHVGYIVAVNAAESRIVLDIGRWFTGRAARQAAIADGVIQPNGQLPDPRYLRNPDHSWRIVHIRSLTLVKLRHYQGADGPTFVTISTLAAIFDSARQADETVRLDPFWVMVDDGEVIEITQQQYKAP